MAPSGTKHIASNRKARRDYTILDVIEAGLVLSGSEVKSLRTGHVQLTDAYARIRSGEVWMEGVHIAPTSSPSASGRTIPIVPASCCCTAARSIA